MRLFIGVWLSEEMREEVIRFMNQIKQEWSGFKWTAPENLHFTLKFLGDVSDSKLENLSKALKIAATMNGTFKLNLGTVGFFPAKGTPRIIWLDVAEGRIELVKLAEAVENNCLNQGFAKNDKPFKAHLTIARVKNEQIGSKFSMPDWSFKTQTIVTGFSLIESRLTPSGPIYRTLDNYIFI